MKDERFLMDARISRDVAHGLIEGGFNGRAIVELVESLGKVVAYLEGKNYS